MKCLVIHNRRASGPKESSWWTFHHISEELKRRGHLFAQYSIDFSLTDDAGTQITNRVWNEADFIFTVFRNGIAPLKIAKMRDIPSFLEINYACEQVATPFMEKEITRLGIGKDEIMYDHHNTNDDLYNSATNLIGAGNREYTEQTYRDHGLDHVKFFKAGIDCELFKPDFNLRSEHKKTNPRIRFTFTAAALAFRKGIIHTLRAWRSLPQEYHDKIELHFFGKPAYGKESIREYDAAMNDFKNIIHHPFMSNQSKEYIYEHGISDVMLCPAFAEGQSATALEGMAFGLYPIVSPYTGSDFEKMPGKILSKDPSSWVKEIADSIRYVVDNYEEVKKTAPLIRGHAMRTYRYEDFAREVIDFMEEVHQKHKK